jgi:hypothetical protein
VLRWLKDLPVAYKVAGVVVGALLLLTVLSPLGLVAAAVLFGVSLIALVVRVAQRRSVRRWGIVAGASLVLVFALGGISNALYGSSKSDYVASDLESDASSNPNYYVADSELNTWQGKRNLGMFIFSDSLSKADLRSIADDIVETKGDSNVDIVSASVYDTGSNVYDPGGPLRVKGKGPKNKDGSFQIGENSMVIVNFSNVAYDDLGPDVAVPKKHYKIVMDGSCDLEKNRCAMYDYPIE